MTAFDQLSDRRTEGQVRTGGIRVSIGLRTQSVCLWSGLLLFAIPFGAGMLLAGFVPPPSPADTAAHIQHLYRSNADTIRVGTVLMTLGAPFLAVWGCAVAAQSARTEKGFPILTCLQLVAIGIGTLIALVIPAVWAIAAFRPGSVGSGITQTLNDVGFFLFLFPWTSLGLWVGALGAAILRDTSDPPIFPRWAAFLNFSAALLSIPGGLIVFAKRGPLAYNGVLAFYVAFAILFVWEVAMTKLTLRAIKRQELELETLG